MVSSPTPNGFIQPTGGCQTIVISIGKGMSPIVISTKQPWLEITLEYSRDMIFLWEDLVNFICSKYRACFILIMRIIWEPPINRRNYKYMVLHIMNREIEQDAGNAEIACSWLSK